MCKGNYDIIIINDDNNIIISRGAPIQLQFDQDMAKMLAPSTVGVERDSPFAVYATQIQKTDQNNARIFYCIQNIFQVIV